MNLLSIILFFLLILLHISLSTKHQHFHSSRTWKFFGNKKCPCRQETLGNMVPVKFLSGKKFLISKWPFASGGAGKIFHATPMSKKWQLNGEKRCVAIKIVKEFAQLKWINGEIMFSKRMVERNLRPKYLINFLALEYYKDKEAEKLVKKWKGHESQWEYELERREQQLLDQLVTEQFKNEVLEERYLKSVEFGEELALDFGEFVESEREAENASSGRKSDATEYFSARSDQSDSPSPVEDEIIEHLPENNRIREEPEIQEIEEDTVVPRPFRYDIVEVKELMSMPKLEEIEINKKHGILPALVMEFGIKNLTNFWIPTMTMTNFYVRPISEDILLHVLRQILGGIKELHEMGFLHNDIKPDNILLMQNTPFNLLNNLLLMDRNMDLIQLKLTDFGSVLPFDKTKKQPEFCVQQFHTIFYSAPEVRKILLNDPEHGMIVQRGPKSDLYSFGRIALELALQTPYFRRLIANNQLHKLTKNSKLPETPQEHLEFVHELGNKMLWARNVPGSENNNEILLLKKLYQEFRWIYPNVWKIVQRTQSRDYHKRTNIDELLAIVNPQGASTSRRNIGARDAQMRQIPNLIEN